MESISTHKIFNDTGYPVELMIDPDFNINEQIVLEPEEEFLLSYELEPENKIFVRMFILQGQHRLLISYVPNH
ncbi:MAG: hypothetical protein ACK518_00890 [bacterium]|jgi:hypothetical protein